MRSARTVFAVALVALLGGSLYGWWRTAPAPAPRATAATHGAAAAPLVDSSALDTARRLAPLAATADEQHLAASAIETADHLLDLAFAAALRAATEHPAPETPAVRAAQQRLDAAAGRLVADNLQVAELTAAAAKAKQDRNSPLEGELALAQAQFEVDQYEFNQAGRELTAAGGDPRATVEALVAEHRAASPKVAPATAAARPGRGLIHRLDAALLLLRKDRALEEARARVSEALADLDSQRQRLAQRVAPAAAASAGAAAATRPLGTTAALLSATRQMAEDHKLLAEADDRAASERQLGRLYDAWRAVVATQRSAVSHDILLDVAIITGVGLLLLVVGRALAAALGRLHVDRRQVETLRTVTTVVLQVVAVLFVALVIIGPPSQLGVFLGLAGAGLTVALKDFIVAFIGWLVLMGRNGMRLGDWVEINGVAGEVVQLGIFHTVLLETGNWTDSGHPTGRRVTFTNSFAIEGHYFNFSTTGQWLWDELEIVVPTGEPLYPVVEAISHKVKEATATYAREAEEEWRRAAPSRQLTGLTAEPALNLKPIVGGTAITLRYIVRANERFRLRATLYQEAVGLLEHKTPASR